MSTRRTTLRTLTSKIGIAAGFLLLLLLTSLPERWIVLAFDTAANVRALQTAVETDTGSLSAAARALVRDVRAWRAEFAPAVDYAPVLRALPRYGGDFAQLAQFARVVDRLTEAAVPSLGLYEQLEQQMARGESIAGALVSVGREHAAEVAGAREAVERAQGEIEKIDRRTLSPKAHALLRRLDETLAQWRAVLVLVERAPVLLGAENPQRYLVLAQNNDEIRPTGGFISAAGILRVERGELSIEWFGDSYAADDLSRPHPDAPPPLEKYMWAWQWLLRDSNWYADFPTSARVAQSMLRNDRGVETDGVIAVDTRLVPLLVGAVDGLELDGAPLAQANVIELLKASWKPLPPGEMSAAWFANDRKNFLGELLGSLLAAFKTGKARTPALAQALWRGLREKSVQLYLEDGPAEQALTDAGWGGVVAPGEADYLFVVDSNVGFNKVNARVTRDIEYTVNLGMSQPEATVEITYHNPSRAAEGVCDLHEQHRDETYASMEESCFWNYVRVLAPSGSRLLAAEGLTDAGSADDIDAVAAFGGYVIIPRSSTQSVRLTYALDKNPIADDRYALKLQQQAGLPATPITLQLQLPPGRTVVGSSHPFRWVNDHTVEFRGLLERDTTLCFYLNPN